MPDENKLSLQQQLQIQANAADTERSTVVRNFRKQKERQTTILSQQKAANLRMDFMEAQFLKLQESVDGLLSELASMGGTSQKRRANESLSQRPHDGRRRPRPRGIRKSRGAVAGASGYSGVQSRGEFRWDHTPSA